ncbi:hypothetical protein [Nocardioides zeicaulis]|uniref:VWA domain-containing protein n=1 Tax=Nocardioides zeicaulis TaxID=1776857 RepID=A0ABV6DXM8_9ACTN
MTPRTRPLASNPGLGAGALLTSLATVLATTAAVLTVAPAGASVTITAPTDARAGVVQLTGSVGAEPGQTTSVLYVLDATPSTGQVTGLDCSGSGTAGGPEDDLNADDSAGDVLDCEVAGVQALNRSLVATAGVQAGVVAFSRQAAAADLDPSGSATFVAPGYTGGDAVPRLDTVVSSVRRNRIGLYDAKDLGGSGSGTAFTSAISVALDTLAAAPAGPKWIMFLSDGQSGIDDAVLSRLGSSGVRLRSFGIGTEASCRPVGSLYKMAVATGETCSVVPRPADLATELAGSQPDAVDGVSVSIGSSAVAATVDAVGGWRAAFTLGAGTYTATARATLASGRVQTTQRTFSVAPGADVPDGSVSAGPGTLHATAVQVARPSPTRAVLPAKVTGRVGRPVDGLTPTRALTGARVVLEARTAAGTTWTAVAAGTADRAGRFALRWKPRSRWQSLRVVLEPPAGFGASTGAVGQPAISACKVSGKGSWTVTCRTTARRGSAVRLLDGRTVVDRAHVRRGTLRLHGTGPVKGTRIEVVRGARKVRLTL